MLGVPPLVVSLALDVLLPGQSLLFLMLLCELLCLLLLSLLVLYILLVPVLDLLVVDKGEDFAVVKVVLLHQLMNFLSLLDHLLACLVTSLSVRHDAN